MLVKERPGPGLSLVEIDKPRIEQSNDVLFEVEYCAICTGELKVFDWDPWAQADTTIELPTVLGHEAVGTVVEVGSGVEGFGPGDRIVVDPLIYCGRCVHCRSGHTNMCEEREIYGKRRGAFAEYALLSEQSVARMPDGLSMEEGALLENLGIAVHAVEVEPRDPGDLAVVIGAGPIGILAAQVMAAQGARVVVTDRVGSRLETARELAGGEVIDVGQEDPVEKILMLSGGRGADFVLEAAGTQSALDQAFDIVRIRGTVVTIGTFGSDVSFNPFFRMTRREVRLLSTMGRTWETWRRMVQLVEERMVELGPLASHVLPLASFEEGFERARSPEVMKVLLKP